MEHNKIYRRAAIISIAVIIFNQLFIQYWLYQKREDASLINLGGRQRMLSQKILVKALLYQDEPDVATLGEIESSFNTWTESHQFLLNKLESTTFLYHKEQTIEGLRELSVFIEHVNAIYPQAEPLSKEALQALTLNQESFLSKMDSLVALMQKDSDRKLRMIIIIELIFAIVSLFLIYYEITYVFKKINIQLAQKNEDLAESNELLEQYAHLASHDLRTPIQNIINFSQLLLHRLKSKLGVDEIEFFDYIVKASKRLKMTTSDLLKVASIQNQELNIKWIDPQVIFKEVLDDLEDSIIQSQAKISIGKMPQNIEADQHSLHLVFQNLLSNSLKFANQNSKPDIEISYQKQTNQHLFIFKDQGIGISDENMKHIFQIFRRVNDEGQFEGTGMGLAISLRLIRKHNGSIEVESKEGEGSTFKVSIPLIMTQERNSIQL